MIPIRDLNPVENRAIVNPLLIGLNVLIFLAQSSQGHFQAQFVYLYGLVPARYSITELSQYFSLGQQLLSFVSFMFLHGGFLHLLGNMWSLYIFGNNVEDHLGPFRYLAFYLLCGLASGVAHLLLNLYSNTPVIGASGAIAGIMGAYFILYPHARILALIPIIIIPYFIEVPAYIFLGLWFLIQLFNAAGAESSGIAWWAHIGGFVFGVGFLKLMHLLPGFGLTRKVRPITAKKTSPHFQLIHIKSVPGDPNLYGFLHITRSEAIMGADKLVNIPWGFHQRIFKVQSPPGVIDGQTLRLKGLGKISDSDQSGDLLLTLVVQ